MSLGHVDDAEAPMAEDCQRASVEHAAGIRAAMPERLRHRRYFSNVAGVESLPG
jgi:hypothetical protein